MRRGFRRRVKASTRVKVSTCVEVVGSALSAWRHRSNGPGKKFNGASNSTLSKRWECVTLPVCLSELNVKTMKHFQCSSACSRLIPAVIVLILIATTVWPAAAQEVAATITAPTDGQELVGVVQITGSAQHPDFDRYEIAYGPDPNPNDAWQPFSSNSQPVINDVLGAWDTTRVADGTYMLRLRVVRKDSNYDEFFVRGLRVVNVQSQNTPTPVAPEPTFPPEATFSSDSPPSDAGALAAPIPTVLVEQPPTSQPAAANTSGTPASPAQRSRSSSSSTSLINTDLVTSTCLSGAALALGVFALVGVIQIVRYSYKQFLRARRRRTLQ
jgi:hypothetical protein